MKSIQWGIIGVGDVTEAKSGPAFQKVEHSELVAVMRRNGSLAADYAQRHNVPKWYDNAESLIRDPEVNAIYIATPPYAHREYTLLAAQAQKPVYVEKPMALNHAECLDMIHTCENAGVPLFVAYYRRALPRFLKIKALIDEGAVGKIRFVQVKMHQPLLTIENNRLPWRVMPELAGGGLFVDLASHMLDILDFLLGPIAEVQGTASNQAGLYPAEDIVSGVFRFESGIHGIGTWCFSTWDSLDETQIIGTKGTLTYATFGESPIQLMTADGLQEFIIENPKHIQQPLIQTIVDELLGKGICPSTGISAARTSKVMETMLNSYYKI